MTTENRSSDPDTMSSQHLSIFPLGLVLFPGAVLPLKIFEQRYLQMTKECVRDDTAFGVCCIRHGREVGAPAEHEQIGCSARILQWDMPHPGFFHLLCAGERVFRVIDRQIEADGLIVGKVEWLAEDTDNTDTDSYGICRDALERIAKKTGEAGFANPDQLADPQWVSYRLSDLMPIDWQQKQALLEQRSTARRLATLSRLLQPT